LDKTYSDQIAVITDWVVNPAEFQIPPVTAEASDPTHWLSLFTARSALQNAGLDIASFDRSRIGVVIGNSLGGEFSRAVNLRLRWPFVERSLRTAFARRVELTSLMESQLNIGDIKLVLFVAERRPGMEYSRISFLRTGA